MDAAFISAFNPCSECGNPVNNPLAFDPGKSFSRSENHVAMLSISFRLKYIHGRREPWAGLATRTSSIQGMHPNRHMLQFTLFCGE